MVNINNVSQNVLTQLKEIEMSDGKKGITSDSERNALAEMLANGEVTGGNNQEYVQGLIDNYDLKQAENNASKDVKDAIKKAVTLDGDKNTLTEREAAVLDQIIDNTMGKYSAEDIQLAKMTKKTMGLTTDTPLGEAKKENAQLKEENAQLETHNENLREVISQYQEKVNELINQMNELKAALETKEKEVENMDTQTKTEIAQLKKQMKAVSDVLLRRLSKPTKEFVDHFEESTKPAHNAISKGAELLGRLGGKAVGSTIANGAAKAGSSIFN